MYYNDVVAGLILFIWISSMTIFPIIMLLFIPQVYLDFFIVIWVLIVMGIGLFEGYYCFVVAMKPITIEEVDKYPVYGQQKKKMVRK